MKCLNIRIVFFDMGGVLVPMASSVQDFKHHVEAAFNINDFSYHSPKYAFVPDLFCKLETNKFDERGFWMEFARALDKPHVISFERFFTDIGSKGRLRPKLKELILQLKQKGIKTAIFSNTCDSLAQRHYRLGHYNLVDYSILSHEVGLHKPDREIFLYALGIANTAPEESLFVDDNEANIEGAKNIGMHTIHFMNTNQFFKELSLFGLPPS